MKDQSSIISIPDEIIFSKIFLIRDKQVIHDRDLADFFQVETKQLKRADAGILIASRKILCLN